MKIDNKTEKEITFGVMAATLAMTLGVTLYSHSNSNHLTSKCPFAFIYGDKVIDNWTKLLGQRAIRVSLGTSIPSLS